MKKLSEISLLALLFIIVMSIIFVIPWAFTNETWFTGVSFENTGNIGDTIGGLTAPFLNGLSAIQVFFAFREQIKANKLFHGMEQKKINLKKYNDLLSKVPDVKTDLKIGVFCTVPEQDTFELA
jgi:hypothetical protein